jgi:hypothetical protein
VKGKEGYKLYGLRAFAHSVHGDAITCSITTIFIGFLVTSANVINYQRANTIGIRRSLYAIHFIVFPARNKQDEKHETVIPGKYFHIE